jgi:predicted HTH transcriptional regulator
MKHPLDNQTVDWCEEEFKSHIAIFERFAKVIQVVRTTPVATTREVQKHALPDMSRRSVQRYIKELIDAGYIKRHEKKDPMGTRLYPTEKVNELLGGAA